MADVWSPLTTHWAVTSECSPRPFGDDAIDSLGHHHAAGTNLMAVLAAAQPGGRDLSMNYVIYRDQIWGVVPENKRAYCSADASADGRSIVYEIINSSGGPDWTFDPVTLDTVKRLDADIMRRRGVKPIHGLPGFWEHRNLWEWFSRSYPTACAGPSFPIYEIIAGAVHYSAPAQPKEDKVRWYHSEDPNARAVGGKTLDPGQESWLNTSPGAAWWLASNVVGGIGMYSITPHVYAEGTPGDVLEITLMWDNTTTEGPHSAHYTERLTVDPSGHIKASREFKRNVDAGYAVYLRVSAGKDNEAPLKLTILDCDAFMFLTA